MLTALKWVAVLPGAIICAVLSSIPLHIVLYQTLTGSGIVEPYPELPERVLMPFVAALVFVLAGSKIAPAYRIETAVVLFGVWLLFGGGMIALALSGAHIGNVQLNLQVAGLAPVGAIIGAFAGLHLVRRHEIRPATDRELSV